MHELFYQKPECLVVILAPRAVLLEGSPQGQLEGLGYEDLP